MIDNIILNLIVLLIVGFGMGELFGRLKFPKLVGYILTGLCLGKTGINWIETSLLDHIDIFTSIALVIILLKSGMGISKEKLLQHKRPAFLLGFLPSLAEGMTLMGMGIALFGFTIAQAGTIGFIVAAISPAIIVPTMINCKNKGLGTKKGVPSLILTSSSLDDIMAILMFTLFFSAADPKGGGTNIAWEIGKVPIGILLGLLVGVCLAFFFKLIVDAINLKNKEILNKWYVYLPIYLILFLILFVIKIEFHKIYISDLIVIMTFGFVVGNYVDLPIKNKLEKTNSEVWKIAQILLFSIIGSIVVFKNLVYNNGTISSNVGYVFLYVLVGLMARYILVFLCVIGTNFTMKERLFIVISNTPKATVQASLGSIPLAAGIPGGELMLAIAVFSIIFTAPIGAIASEISSTYLLEQDPDFKKDSKNIKKLIY